MLHIKLESTVYYDFNSGKKIVTLKVSQIIGDNIQYSQRKGFTFELLA